MLTFSLKQKIIRKTTIDNIVKYFANSERDSKPNTVKNDPLPKKTKKFNSQSNKKLLSAQRFNFLK